MIRQSRNFSLCATAGVLLFFCGRQIQAFVFSTAGTAPLSFKSLKVPNRHHERRSPLFYKNLPDDESVAPQNDEARKRRPGHLSIPIMGPFVRSPPILPVGEEPTIAPTPMQWQALEECVLQHQQQYSKKKGSNNNNNDSNVAGVSAAPLVAILDDYTATAGTQQDRGARYATLAAVVGVVEKKNKVTSSIDSDDNESFMESLFATNDKNLEVRLMGVGRAVLTDFHYQVPLALQQANMDEDGHLILNPSREARSQRQLGMQVDEECLIPNDDDADDDERHECDTTDSIIMARFRLYQDMPTKATSSPVHALSQFSTWTSKINLLHEERKQLVAELQAVRTRQLDEELEDHDGLGDLFASKKEFRASRGTEERSPSTVLDNNFGLGTTAASVSTLASVTSSVQNKLKPYYSPKKHASEEHYYELYSFVAVQALSNFVGPSHVAWAVRCSDTAERLRVAHEWMRSHVESLKDQLRGSK